MKHWLGLLLTLSCLAQESVTTDDMWDALTGQSGGAATPSGNGYNLRLKQEHAIPRAAEPGAPAANPKFNEILELARKRAAERAQKEIAGPIEWKDANLSMRFGNGWRKMPSPLPENTARMYFNPGKQLLCTIVFVPLAADDDSTIDAVFESYLRNRKGRLHDLKKVEAKGRAAEFDMRVAEAVTRNGDEAYQMVTGSMIRNGALYNINMVAEEREVARENFDLFLTELRFPDDKAKLSLPTAEELNVPAAGFRASLAGRNMAATDGELPNGSGAMHIDKRFEIAAFDMKDCAVPLRDAAEAFLANLQISAGKKHESREFEWGGIPALRFTSKEPSPILSMDMDWSLACGMHGGFFCIAMGYWPTGERESARQFEQLLADTVFGEGKGLLLDPENPASRQWLGHFYNESGLKAFNRGQYGVSSPAFERAARLLPEDPVVAQNVLQSLNQQGRTQAALDAVIRARSTLPEHQDLKEWHACLLVRCNRAAAADPLFEELLAAGCRNRESLLLWIDSLQKNNRAARATELAGFMFKETGQSDWRRVLANCLWSENRPAEALPHYDAIAADYGIEPGFVAEHAALLVDCGEHKRAIDLITEWEKTGEAATAMLFTKGMAQSHLGWFKEAVATFTKLDERAPGNQTVREALMNARGMLGQGSQEGFRDDLPAVDIPAELTERSTSALASAEIAAAFPGEGWVSLEDIRVWHWKEGSDARMTHRRKIRILDASGVEIFSTLYIPLRPSAERVNVHRMTVTASDGSTLEEYKRGEVHVRDANTGLADGHKLVCLPVPTLTEGAVIDFEYTKSLSGTAGRFPMTTEYLQEQGAMVYGAVAFTGEVGKLRFASSERLESFGQDGMRAYEAKMVRRPKVTNYAPPYDRWGLPCWATDARTTWESETKEYLDEIAGCLADDSFAGQAVADLGLKQLPRHEAVRKVVRWLNDKYQYQGIEFGRRARMPAPGSATIKRGYGDCKDLSVMVRAILRAAGIEARLALVNSNGIVRTDVPGFDQFDHMILHLPEDGLFLDPTLRKFNTPEALNQYMIDSPALVIEGKEPEFVTMKEKPGQQRSTNVTRTVRIDPESGDATVEETVEMSPPMASMMRMMLSSTAGAERRTVFESMMRRREPRMEWKSFEVRGLEDPFLPLTLQSVYRMNDAFTREGRSLIGGIPPVMERMAFELAPDRDRNIGVLVRAPEDCVTKTRYIVPEGYEWSAPDTPEFTVPGPPMFKGTVRWTGDGNEASLEAAISLMPGEGDTTLYSELRNSSEDILRKLDQQVRFRSLETLRAPPRPD